MIRHVEHHSFDAHAAPRRGRVRRGTSLLEVLVGLGIMAVGAIGAFVLFPLSAINVSRALIDDRATTCAVTADGQMRDIHRTSPSEPYRGLMALAPNPEEASLAVAVDPMGYFARGVTASAFQLGDNGETGIPRANLSTTYSANLALRFCSQMDGLTFDEAGGVPPALEMRELRYNWMWVLQRPVSRDPATRMQVVVFDKRAHLYAPPGSEDVYPKPAVGPIVPPRIVFVPGSTEITGIPNTAEVRKGTWIMDATTNVVAADGRTIRHAEFYRVTNVVDNAGTLTLELHKPIRRLDGLVDRINLTTTGNAFRYNGTVVVMPAVVEVFERPVLLANTP